MTHIGAKIQLLETDPLANTYYGILGLHPSASVLEIRRCYRELSKRYHPDTTELPEAIARSQFQQLNEAYATLSNPDRRSLYDLKIGYSRINVLQPPTAYRRSSSSSHTSYLDPTDRPLSSGEIFALCLMSLTFLGCLVLVIVLAALRGEAAWQLPTPTANILLLHFW